MTYLYVPLFSTPHSISLMLLKKFDVHIIGEDNIGEDNKTIIHYKVAARIIISHQVPSLIQMPTTLTTSHTKLPRCPQFQTLHITHCTSPQRISIPAAIHQTSLTNAIAKSCALENIFAEHDATRHMVGML